MARSEQGRPILKTAGGPPTRQQFAVQQAFDKEHSWNSHEALAGSALRRSHFGHVNDDDRTSNLK